MSGHDVRHDNHNGKNDKLNGVVSKKCTQRSKPGNYSTYDQRPEVYNAAGDKNTQPIHNHDKRKDENIIMIQVYKKHKNTETDEPSKPQILHGSSHKSPGGL